MLAGELLLKSQTEYTVILRAAQFSAVLPQELVLSARGRVDI